MTPGQQTTGGPQRMKANWKVVETKCLTCYGPFTFGEDVSQCMQCGGYHHSGCWNNSGGCTHPAGIAAAGRSATVLEGVPAIPPPMPPPPPVTYGMPPQPMRPLAPGEQYCPRCGNIVRSNMPSCPFCNSILSYGPPPMFGQQPYGGGALAGNYEAMRPDLESRASGARNCGLIALICWGIQFLIGIFIGINARGSTADAADTVKAFIVPILLLGLTAIVLGIVAIVKGNGVKRILEQFPHDPSLRSRANAGVVMGWIGTAIFAFGVIMNIVKVAGSR